MFWHNRSRHTAVKLEKYGARGKELQLSKSYLENGSQNVRIACATNKCLPVTKGVCQGSILGLLLFLIFMNDFPTCLKDFFKECWLLSTQTLQWSRLPDMKNERSRHQSVYCEGNAYVFDGGAREYAQHAERLEKGRSQRVSMPTMPEGRTNAAAVGYGSLIYICGGDRPDHVWESTDTILELNTLSQVWSERAPMPVRTSEATALVFRRNIYVVGGEGNCCLSYNVGENQWTKHSPPVIGCTLSTAVIWHGRLLLCGGSCEPGSDWGTLTEQYDEKTNTWSRCKLRLPQGPCKRHLFCTEIPRDKMAKDLKPVCKRSFVCACLQIWSLGSLARSRHFAN